MHRGIHSLEQRLDLIAKRIDVSVTRPQKAMDGRQYMLKDLTHTVIRGLPQTGPESESEPINAIFRYVRYGIETREDPTHYDYYPAAGRTINSGAEDCDGKVILLNSMLESIGYTTGARVISPDGKLWHIYSVVGTSPAFNGQPSEVLPLDPRYGDEPGWEPADRYRNYESQCTFVKGRVVGFKTIRSGKSLFSFLRAAGLNE
ncbi:MAG: hypothetical protein ACYTBJ_00050 [Planctomycetota bacterium]